MKDQDPHRSGTADSRRGALVGVVVALLVVVAGLALVHVLRRQGQIEDCVMSGRTNCAPIDSAAAGH